MITEFRLEGAAELEAALRALGPGFGERAALAAVLAGARVARRHVQSVAPRGSQPPHPKYGRLRDNIRVAATARTAPEFTVAVHTGRAFWGSFLEFGTATMAARPWFTSAFEAASEAALRELGEACARGINREAERLAGKRK